MSGLQSVSRHEIGSYPIANELPLSDHESTSNQYEVNDVVRLLAATYNHSRGAGDTVQQPVLKFIAHNYGDRFTQENLEAAEPALTAVATKFVALSGIHPSIGNTKSVLSDGLLGAVSSDVELVVDYLRSHIEAQDSDLTPEDSEEFIAGLISQEEGQIPFGPSNLKDKHTQPSRYKSNFVEYVLLGRSTSFDELDAFYKEISLAFSDGQKAMYKDDSYTAKKMHTVIAAHLAYNPSDSVDLANSVAK